MIQKDKTSKKNDNQINIAQPWFFRDCKNIIFITAAIITLTILVVTASGLNLFKPALFASTVKAQTRLDERAKKDLETNNLAMADITKVKSCVAWVAVGSGTNSLATSEDGITWTGRGGIFTLGSGVAFNGKTWVAVGDGPNPIVTSTDGIIWTGRDKIFKGGVGVAWNGSMWVAVGYQKYGDRTNRTSIATSTDGIKWVARSTPMLTGAANVAWNGSSWLVTGENSYTGFSKIVISTDGINWTERASQFSSTANDVAWNGHNWIVVGSGQNVSAVSSDGTNWTVAPYESTPFVDITGVAWNGNMWVGVGVGKSGEYPSGTGIIATSTDGISWTARDVSKISYYAKDVAWNGSRWIVVGYGYPSPNTIVTSTDGINWVGLGNTIFNSPGGLGVASSEAPSLYPPRTCSSEPEDEVTTNPEIETGTPANTSTQALPQECHATFMGWWDWCAVLPTARYILSILLAVFGSGAVLMLIYGGILYITSSGDSKKTDHAKKVITYTLLGVLIVTATWGLISLTASLIGAG
ncbi:MAG: hypothetical protein WCI63_02280 [bacterium]